MRSFAPAPVVPVQPLSLQQAGVGYMPPSGSHASAALWVRHRLASNTITFWASLRSCVTGTACAWEAWRVHTSKAIRARQTSGRGRWVRQQQEAAGTGQYVWLKELSRRLCHRRRAADLRQGQPGHQLCGCCSISAGGSDSGLTWTWHAIADEMEMVGDAGRDTHRQRQGVECVEMSACFVLGWRPCWVKQEMPACRMHCCAGCCQQLLRRHCRQGQDRACLP